MEIRAEWGRLNARQRFNVLALDIDRAIQFVGLNRYEGLVLEQAREESWHGAILSKRAGEPWPDPKPARLNLYRLAQETGLELRRLREAKAFLLASRIFLPGTIKRSVRINKQADEWIDPATGMALLKPQWVSFCAEARPEEQAFLPLSDGAETRTQTVRKPAPKRCGNPHPNGAETRTLPIEERGRVEIQESFLDVCVEGGEREPGSDPTPNGTHKDEALSEGGGEIEGLREWAERTRLDLDGSP